MARIEKPWGYEEIWAQTKSYVGKKMLIRSGQRMSLQYHEVKEETIYVLSGFLILWQSEDNKDFKILKPGDTFHVKPGEVHRFGADCTEDVILIEVSTPELDDVIRLADDYERGRDI